jgi:hypothetical protein
LQPLLAARTVTSVLAVLLAFAADPICLRQCLWILPTMESRSSSLPEETESSDAGKSVVSVAGHRRLHFRRHHPTELRFAAGATESPGDGSHAATARLSLNGLTPANLNPPLRC